MRTLPMLLRDKVSKLCFDTLNVVTPRLAPLSRGHHGPSGGCCATRRATSGLTVTGLALGTLLLTGCGTTKISTEYDAAYDYSVLESFAWIDGLKDEGGEDHLDDALETRIRSMVDRELRSRGFRKSRTTQPDFLVAYHLAFDEAVGVGDLDEYYGDSAHSGLRYGPDSTWEQTGSDGGAAVREYEVGSLVLNFIDPASKELIWRGSARAEIWPDSEPQQREERVQRAVQRILMRFPPRP